MDYYLKGGDRDYTLANPQNFRPMFSQEQLTTSLHATHLRKVALHAASIFDTSIPLIDSTALLEDIKSAYAVDPTAIWELNLCLNGTPSPRFSVSHLGLLLLDHHVYVPEYRPNRGNLHTHVLQEKHDHPTTGHFGYNKMLELLRQDYVWPSMCMDCKLFVLQCVLCMHNKPSCH